MDNENPCKGLIFPGEEYTYKDLCDAVNDKQRGGDSKKAQLKKWARHFSWEYPINPKTGKPSKKFLIKEVFEEVLPEETRCEYDVSDIILLTINEQLKEKYCHYDSEEDVFTIGISKSKMNELIGLCNQEYIKTMKEPLNDIPVATHKDFFKTTNSSFDYIVKTSFKRLEKKNVLRYIDGTLWYSIYYDPKDDEYKRIYHLASMDENVIIDSCKYKAIQEWNESNPEKKVNNYGDASFKLSLQDQWLIDEIIKNMVREHIGGYSGSITCHQVFFKNDVIDMEISKRGLDKANGLLDSLKSKINEQMMIKVKTDATKRYEKAHNTKKEKKKVTKRDSGFGVSAIPMSKAMEYRLQDEDYVKHCDDIASVVIPLKDEQ